jgi:peptidoglycan hydrolase-like protein with peptidoglycan-binding domain
MSNESLTGPSLLDKSKAHPGNIDMSVFAPKSKPTAQGTVNARYLQETREQNPDPAEAKQDEAKVSLSKCRFVTPPEDLRLNEPFEFAVDVKKLGSPKSMSPSFDLYCTRTRDGKPERDRIWACQRCKPLDPKADPLVVQGKEVLATQADYVLGETVTFELEATHPEADQPARSEPVEIRIKGVAHWIGGDDLFFRNDGEFPLLGTDGSLLQVLATAVGRIRKPAQEGETCICFGFASSAGEAGPNRRLSLRRAQAVKALLDRDEAAWVELAKAHFETRDIQQFLSDLHAACGWECDPGAVDGQDGPRTKAAIESFQKECNVRYKRGLAEDGICGPKTWGAVHRVVLGQVQAVLGEDESKAPSWPQPKWGNRGKGVHGNGEDYATGGDKPEERSVQITFFAPGTEPPLKEVADGQKASPEHNPVQQPDRIEKVKIPAQQLKLSTPPVGPVLQVGLFFDGTWNNRSDDLPKRCESNIAKLYELFDGDLVTRFGYYYEGVGTGNVVVSDKYTGGLGGRGAQDRIERAFDDLRQLLQKNPGASLELSLFGFSRGASTARSFVNQLFADPSRIGVGKRPFAKIAFVGLFDTVGSFGIPGDSDEAGHDLSVHVSRIQRLVHLVARDEKRSLFPLTRIRIPGSPVLPTGWEERTYPGVHADLGGGYGNEKSRQELQAYEQDERFRRERDYRQSASTQSIHLSEKPNLAKLKAEAPRDCLSRIPFWVMYDLAAEAGVPLHRVETVLPPPDQAHSADWWHSAPEEEKRKATWVRFQGRKEAATLRLEIPPRLRTYWEKRHVLSKGDVWTGSEAEMQDIAYFQHDSLYMWESHQQIRKTIDRGVTD